MSGNLWILIGIVCLAISAFAVPYGFYLKSKEASNRTTTEITGSVQDSKAEILEAIRELQSRLTKGEDLSEDDLTQLAQKTYEIVRNMNANLLLKRGYEKEGGFGTWVTPAWQDHPERKFYLLDFVGNLDKNRISVFVTEENELVCQILTSDGREEFLSVDIGSWKKSEPHLIILQWKTEEDRVELFVDKAKYVKIIPHLSFDVLGPIVFMGIDFEGKYPGRFKRGGPKISEALEKMGWDEYRTENP